MRFSTPISFIFSFIFMVTGTLISFQGQAQFKFTPKLIASGGQGPAGASYVDNKDLDGDGDLDLLVAAADAGTVFWYENDGTGNFSNPIVIDSNATEARCVQGVDVDSDGDMDILIAFDHEVGWYENDGSNNFTYTQIDFDFSYTLDAQSLKPADINSDGNIDFLFAAGGSDAILWYENDGAGNFTQNLIQKDNDFTGRAFGVDSMDVDNDGDLDAILAARDASALNWYENDGAGNFTHHLIDSTSSVTGEAISVYSGDYNGDGNQDIIFAAREADIVSWYENDGAGNFTQHTIDNTLSRTEGANDGKSADLDNDGDEDILLASFHAGALTWYENDGSGNFTAHNIEMDTAHTNGAYSIDIGDLTGNGNIDISLVSELEGAVSWYENDGTGNFTHHLVEKVDAQVQGASSATSTDFNGDGERDIISTAAFSDAITGFSNDGNENFTPATIDLTPSRTDFAHSVDYADVDGDNDMDLFFAATNSDIVAWYENDGNGQFTYNLIDNTLANTEGAFAVRKADLNNDGNPDVVLSSQTADALSWYENDGAGNFTHHLIQNNASYTDEARTIKIKDIDGDSDEDIVLASGTSNALSWYENDGSGNFTHHLVDNNTSNTSGAWGTDAADIDGDGDIDLVLSARTAGKVSWYENDGSQNFTQQLVGNSNFASGTHEIRTIDPKGNGNVHLILASGTEDAVSLYKNDGTGNFTHNIVDNNLSRTQGIYGLSVSDVDNDGDPDFISTAINADAVVYYSTCIEPEIDSLYSVPPALCDGDTGATIHLNGALNEASKWYLYSGNCGGTVIDSTTTDSFEVSITDTTTYFVRGEGGCVGVGECDTLTINVFPTDTVSQNLTICEGDSVVVGSSVYDTAGTYVDTLTNTYGCDSLVTTNLNVDTTYLIPATDTICDGDSILLGGAYQDTAGFYYDTLQTTAGCDSVIETDLSVLPSYLELDSATICEGDSILLAGAYRDTAGIYHDTLQSSAGCDSILATDLTVLSYHTLDTATICDGDSILLGGDYQTTAGTYLDTLSSNMGCDSVVETNLSVQSTYQVQTVANICENDSIYLGGQWTDTVGTYYDTLQSSIGCDSIVETSLSVSPVYTTQATDTICDGDSIMIGTVYHSTAGTYYDTLTSQNNGCDSIVAVELTIAPDYLMAATATICEGDSMLLGGQYQTTSGTYYDSLQSKHGCDSVIATSLTVEVVDTSVTQVGVTLTSNDSGSTYQWLECTSSGKVQILGADNQDYTPSQNGVYAVAITTSNNCKDTSGCHTINSIGIEEHKAPFQVEVYPNPNDGEFKIQLNTRIHKGQITVHNTLGEVVLSENMTDSTQDFDLGDVESGIYFVRIRTEKGVVERKISVE